MAKNKQQVIQLTDIPEIRFGDRLRVLRRALRLGQDEMGQLLEIDGGRYGNWEAGSAKPRDLVATAQLLEDKTRLPRFGRVAPWAQNWKLLSSPGLHRLAES